MCSRIFWNDNGISNAVARSLDWSVSDEPQMWFVPRGTERTGGPQPNAQTWTSQYATLTLSMWDAAAIDGLNERGLAAHTLYLNPEDVEFPDPGDRPTIAHAMWLQYVLDTCATVAEAVEVCATLPIYAIPVRDWHVGAHLALEDASGDSAIIEPIAGRFVIHHGREFQVMTNSPSLDDHLQNLARYRDFGGELPPPGDITSTDRFVRANYFLKHLPQPATQLQAVAGVVQLIDNVAVPFGAPYDEGGTYPTWWRSIIDTTTREYFFRSTFSPSIFMVQLDPLVDGTEVLSLDPNDENLEGDATPLFRPSALPFGVPTA